MTDVVVGGGPAGLSAALFTAKNELSTTVFDTDETWMHKAHLWNYSGIESQDGTAFTEASRNRPTASGPIAARARQSPKSPRTARGSSWVPTRASTKRPT